MSEVLSLPVLRLTRGHLKGSLTKLASYTETISESSTIVELEVKLQKAEDLWNEFNASQKQIYEHVGKEGYTNPMPDFEDYEDKYLMVKSVIVSAIKERERVEKDKDVVSRLADQQKILIDTLSKSDPSMKNSDFFLPSIRIEPFSGNYREWPAFRDMFEGAVHNKAGLTPIQKFHFLKSCLRNEALNLLNHLPICVATYEQAWARLEKRYNRPRHVINSYIRAFMELPATHTSNTTLLRKISDGADEIVRGLISINSINRDPWLIYILLNKLDPETRQAWMEDSVAEDYPTIDQFLDFLELRCEALESCKTNIRDNPRTKHAAARSLHVSSSTSCEKCSSSHALVQCAEFLGMSIQDRRDFVKSHKLCFNCLRGGHPSARCQSKFRCRACNTRHHTLVHDDAVNKLSPSHHASTSPTISRDTPKYPIYPVPSCGSNAPSTSAHAASLVNNHSNVAYKVPLTLLPTAVGNVIDKNGNYQPVRILLDSGSQVSFITESCVQRLGLPRRNARIPISGIGSTNAGQSRGLASFVICSRFDKYTIPVDTYILSSVTKNLPSSSFAIEDYHQLYGLNLADPDFNKSCPVDVLLGADKVWEILQGNVVRGKSGQPIAQQTIFGWVLAGPLLSNNQSNVTSYHNTVDIDSLLQSFWTIEEVDPKSIVSKEDREIEEHFLKTHSRATDGRYIVNLPFKSTPNFADTLRGAISRLQSMERKFSKSPDFFEAYSRFLDDYLALGHMSEISQTEIENPNVFYLPHHAVLKPDSQTTKLRVVFDGSHKDTKGNNLNDSLMIGPPIQRNLFSVCLRFRRFRFAFIADIVQMYRQIRVSVDDSDYQRIVWRESPSAPLRHFRLCTVTYGTSCAPYLAVRTLQQHAETYKDKLPIASDVILNDFYVDDVASGADTLAEAIFKRDSLVELLSKCGMTLSKWHSNSRKLLPEDVTLSQTNRSLDTAEDSWVKVLGLSWNSSRDVFRFDLNYTPNTSITKRQILRDVARIFDPLGFLSPTIIQLKILLQELWHRKTEWDEDVPTCIANKWTKYREELLLLTQISVPRVIGLGYPAFELHGFSDASESAYAAVIYSRYQLITGQFETNIVAAKTRVAPLKQLSIPRLELCGAVLLSRLLVAVQNSLNVTFPNVYAWSDSKVVLSWLSSPPRRWNVFVGNRTAEILSTIPRNRWFHVKSECNPADCASRGILPSQLLEHSIWWTGPKWLRYSSENWPTVSQVEDDPDSKKEEKRTVQQSYLITTNEHPFEILSERISSWTGFIRTVARIYHFIVICRKQGRSSSHFLRPQEIYSAKMHVIKWLQIRYFGDDIAYYKNHNAFPKNCKIGNLSPFLDSDNILRVGGRLQHSSLSFNTKHPIIIPKDHTITKLIVLDAHIRFLHPGISTLFALIRQEYWIIGCRNLLRKITHTCIRCFRQRKATISQLMGNLPPQRIHVNRPFAHCGCDYAGPISLKIKSGRKSTLSKGYISLFVCLVTKAIHLEVVSDLTTESFLSALRRFTARRGKPSHIYSDNGTNFRGCARLLTAMHELVWSEHHNSIVAESLARDGISWHFIPPAAPHFGGLWEAGVKSVKQHLRRVINDDVLTFEQLYTLLTQIEAILNSRPLCQISDTELDPLTPAHFCLGESYAAIPEPMIDVPTNRLTTWQNLQAKIQGYWKRWQSEYLTSLQQRPKWQHIEKNIKVNDLVVIKEPNLPPGKWAMGRVIEIHPASDGLIRVVELRTAKGNLTRPIHKLAVLPVC